MHPKPPKSYLFSFPFIKCYTVLSTLARCAGRNLPWFQTVLSKQPVDTLLSTVVSLEQGLNNIPQAVFKGPVFKMLYSSIENFL